MPEYLIYFNQQWVGDHTEEWFRSRGPLAAAVVEEMEAAALYTFARVKGVRVLCLAHVTNTMGLAEQDFEKGEADGTAEALMALAALARDLT